MRAISQKIRTIINPKDRTMRSGIINVMLKPVSMLLSIVYVPVLLGYLGEQNYGLWVTLLSIINWINYFDVGIGNGLRNLLAKELGANDFVEAKKSVSTAYIVLSIIALIVFGILLILVYLINWKNVFSTDMNMEIPILISGTFICINFVLALSNILLYALQLSERVAVRGCFIQFLNLVGMVLLSCFFESSLIAVALLYGSTTFLVNVANTFSIMRKREYLRPNVKNFQSDKIKTICSVGIKFFVIQIMALLLFTTDNLLIAHFFGADVVTPFSIADKLFNTAYMVLAAFLVPYWSRSTVAFEQNDRSWIIKSLKRVCKVSLVFFVGYILLLSLFYPAVRIWLGYSMKFQSGIPALMCMFYIFYSILGVECQFINGSGKINTQLILYIIAGILNIPLSIFLGVTCQLEGFGIRLASTILVFIQIVILGINLRSIINNCGNNC